MFSRTFGIVMSPAVVLIVLLSSLFYIGNTVVQYANGEYWAAIFWFVVWGHILSMLGAALIVLPILAILGVLAASAAWLFSVAWGFQKRGVESLPFSVRRKDH